MVEVYLEQSGVKVKLPFPPETLPISTSSDNKTYNLLSLGDITTLSGIPKQYTITYKSLFPTRSVPNLPKNTQSPSYYVNAIWKMQKTKEPIDLYITGTSYGDGLALKVSIDSFQPVQRTGKTGIIDYTLTFKEYRTVTSNFLKTITLPPLPDIAYMPVESDNKKDTSKGQSDLLSSEVLTSKAVTDSHMGKLDSIGIQDDTTHLVSEVGERLVDITKKYYGTTAFDKYVLQANPNLSSVLKVGDNVILPSLSNLQKMGG